MDICFFTMSNKKMLPWARRLVSSGDTVNRPVWYYRIPPDHPDPKRYKIELLAGDLLPKADKYVFLDADCIMQSHGEWESEEWTGAKHELWGTSKQYSGAFPGREGWETFAETHDILVMKHGEFPRLNSGTFAISEMLKRPLSYLWKKWNDEFDAMTTQRLKVRDQIGFGFAAIELGIGALPDKVVGIPKREVVDDSFCVIHASGRPNPKQLTPYSNAVRKVLGGYLRRQNPQKDGYRWHELTRLLMRHAEDSAHPVMAEIGVFKGWNTEHLLKAFPGLTVHGCDSREPPGPQKKHTNTDEVWEAMCAQYPGRVTFQRCPGMEAVFDEPLDLIFEDSDHTTEMVIEHAQHLWPYLKMGGVYVVHDLDYRGTYYSGDSVRKAMNILFPIYHTGADKTAWVVKTTEEIPGHSFSSSSSTMPFRVDPCPLCGSDDAVYSSNGIEGCNPDCYSEKCKGMEWDGFCLSCGKYFCRPKK